MTTSLPSYLRVVATTRCNNRCAYCHGEGEKRKGRSKELPLPLLAACLRVAARAGVRKLKLVGGEPFLRQDLPELIAGVRRQQPELDISVITAGIVDTKPLDRALEAGLSRVNVSVHGFTPEQLSLRNRSTSAYERRERFLHAVLGRGRPMKLNYVYSGDQDREDLGALLDWAASRPVVVNVLDNLSIDMNWRDVDRAVRSLRGNPEWQDIDLDPHSLPTMHLHWSNGLCVEIKHSNLGSRAPYPFCSSCPKRQDCREGTMALRLTSGGLLVPCMDRVDLGVPLAKIVAEQGEDAALNAWRRFGEAA